ncbi:MAG TPA: DUF5777 family beta-barrel protein [Acidobacteriota bacterium]|nr:DUF5777 family beta-barrel protein [Acidobacteriota bacterium]
MRSIRFMPLLPAMILGTATILLSYSRGPLPRLTGGFGEATCTSCHQSYPLNEGRLRGGVFQIVGAPKSFTSGTTYPVTVVLGQPGQSRWGFELSARFANTGKQAGKLVPADEMTQVVESEGIQYIEHTEAGTRAGTADGTVEFHFNWIAPDPSGGLVIFNASGNASNSNNNPTGDYIYTAGAWSGVGAMTYAAPEPAHKEPARKKEAKWGDRVNDASKIVDLPAPVHLRKGAFEMHIQHRFVESLPDSRPGDAFGVDSGANINLAVNHAFTDRFSLGVSRARFGEVIAWTGTYEIQTQKESFWKMSLVGGVEGQRNLERQYSPYLQLASRIDYKGLSLYVVPTAVFHSRDRALVDLRRSDAINPDSNNTFSLGVGGDIAINSRFSIVGEIVPRLAGFGGFGRHRPTISTGIEMRSWGHVFTILVSSSRDFTPAEYAVNPGQSDVSLGFNIYRRMR